MKEVRKSLHRRSRSSFLAISVGCCFLALLVGGWTQRVELEVQPLFGTHFSDRGAFPLLVTLQNKGASLRGVLVTEIADYRRSRRYLYPLDLPSGSRKQVVVTPTLPPYTYQVVVRLETPRPIAQTEVQLNPMGESSILVVGIGDEIGGLGFLNRFVPGRYSALQEPSYQPSYCRPEHLPTRAYACSGVGVFILGPGAERLSESQYRALRLWVLMGGLLVVPGGSAALYLQNPALTLLLPIRHPVVKEVKGLPSLGSFTGIEPPSGRVILTQGTPLPTARVWLQEGGIPLMVFQPYGLGGVLFLAFNPWDQPFRSWKGNAALWSKLLERGRHPQPAWVQWAIFANHSGQDEYLQYGYYGSSWPSYYPPSLVYPSAALRTSLSDVKVETPEVGLVIGLLLLYFVLVVPVNFFLLKRLRALDWAWLTAPLIALVFVLLFYWVGRGIYKMGQSAHTQATVLMQAGEPQAYAYASTLFFFPRAGYYEMQFTNTEMVETGFQEGYGGWGRIDSLETVEGDPILVPGYRVRNLSFYWFRYARVLELPGSLQGELKLVREGNSYRLRGHLQNGLPYPLKEVQLLYLQAGKNEIARLNSTTRLIKNSVEPGESCSVNLAGLQLTRSDRQQHPRGRPVPPFYPQSVRGDPIIAGMARRSSDSAFALLKMKAEEPNLVPSLEVGGRSRQAAVYYCTVPLRMEP